VPGFSVGLTFGHAPYMPAVATTVVIHVRVFAGLGEPLNVFRAAGRALRVRHGV
jgi:hypothetical protein